MSENKSQKTKTSKKPNPAKQKTSEKKIPAPKSENSNRIVPKNFWDLVKSVYFSVPSRPVWIAGLFTIGYLLVKQTPINKTERDFIDLILGSSLLLSGYLAVQRKEFPHWLYLMTGGSAVVLGWVAIFVGGIASISAVLNLIF